MMTNRCMSKYKEKFTLEFAKVMQVNAPKWNASQKHHVKNLYTTWLLVYISIFFAGFTPLKNELNYNLNFHIILAIIGLIGSIFAFACYESGILKEEIKKDLYTKLLKAFGHDIVYDCGEISCSEYNNSMLFNKPVRYASVDDKFCGIFNGSPFVIAESHLNYIKTTHGKTQETTLFNGVSMYFKMQKKVKSRVLVYSKGLLNINVPKGFEKVEFEYEKFNKKYDVYVQKSKDETRGQIEARYLFNTAFMDRFMQLQTSFKVGKMKCSIYDDTMLVLLPTNRDLFEINPLFKKIDDINNYQTLFDEFASVLSFLEILNLSSKTGL